MAFFNGSTPFLNAPSAFSFQKAPHCLTGARDLPSSDQLDYAAEDANQLLSIFYQLRLMLQEQDKFRTTRTGLH